MGESFLPEHPLSPPRTNWGHKIRRWHLARPVAKCGSWCRTPGSKHRKVHANGHLLREVSVCSCHLLQREPGVQPRVAGNRCCCLHSEAWGQVHTLEGTPLEFSAPLPLPLPPHHTFPCSVTLGNCFGLSDLSFSSIRKN